ncbi:MAG: twin-arginine translocase subunit TatB [Alphaproteobacteria bacterium]|nr:twin-arginine translocase subunit TatB [Alphaproteobacteria bacterium]MBN9593655.1 twin-arginine translocase subunit TatB [Alphaproteobacteria bacterium]
MPAVFDLSWSEILVVLIVALVVVGPKDLPRLMHMMGRWMGKARNMANEFRKSFDEMARQAELDELRKEIAALRAERPLSDLDRPVEHGIAPANSPDPKLDDPEVMAEGTGEVDANQMDVHEPDAGAENTPPPDDDPVDSDPAPVVRP